MLHGLSRQRSRRTLRRPPAARREGMRGEADPRAAPQRALPAGLLRYRGRLRGRSPPAAPTPTIRPSFRTPRGERAKPASTAAMAQGPRRALPCRDPAGGDPNGPAPPRTAPLRPAGRPEAVVAGVAARRRGWAMWRLSAAWALRGARGWRGLRSGPAGAACPGRAAAAATTATATSSSAGGLALRGRPGPRCSGDCKSGGGRPGAINGAGGERGKWEAFLGFIYFLVFNSVSPVMLVKAAARSLNGQQRDSSQPVCVPRGPVPSI